MTKETIRDQIEKKFVEHFYSPSKEEWRTKERDEWKRITILAMRVFLHQSIDKVLDSCPVVDMQDMDMFQSAEDMQEKLEKIQQWQEENRSNNKQDE